MTRERVEDLGRIFEIVKYAIDSPAFSMQIENEALKDELDGLSSHLSAIYAISSGQDFLNEPPIKTLERL